MCHSTHGGTNNNMGVEVDWRDIKKICPPSAGLSTFLGTLFHFVKNLGEEHEEFLEKEAMPNLFLCEPVFHKFIWDAVQDVHPKTLVCSFIFVRGGKVTSIERDFTARVQAIYDQGDAPLHLKIEVWHESVLSGAGKGASPLNWNSSCYVS